MEENTDVAIALGSVATLRDPFSLTDPFNLSSDSQARVMLFATNLDLFPGENSSAVTVRAEDNQGNVYPITVEFVGKVPSFDWLSEIVIKLPPNLPTGQDVQVSITLHAQTSNRARLRLK